MQIKKLKIKNQNDKKFFLINHKEKSVESYRFSLKNNKDNSYEMYEVHYKEFENFLINNKELNYTNFLAYVPSTYKIKKVKNDEFYIRDSTFLDELVFIRDGIYDVLIFSTYKINIFDFKKKKSSISNELFYLVKNNQNKKIYAKFFEEDNKVDMVSEHYEKNKKFILNQNLVDSFNELNKVSFILNDELRSHFKINKHSFTKLTKEYYPSLRNKLYEEISKQGNNFSFIYFLINEHFIPFNSIAYAIQKKHTLLEVVGDELFFEKILKETSSYKQLKCMIPKANRETFHILSNLDTNFFNKGTSPINVRNRSHLILSLLNVFETTENLNTFMKESSFYLSNDGLDFKRIVITDVNDNNSHLMRDIKNELPKFFNSQKQFENAMINQIRKYTDDIISNKHSEYFYDTPYEMLYSILLNSISLYRHTLEIRKRFVRNGDTNTVKLLDIYLNRKYIDFDDLHDKLTEIIQQIQYNPTAIFNKIDFKELEDDSFKINQVLSAADLRSLGVEMNHCVLSYQPSIEDDKIVIFELVNEKTNEKELCIEYNIDKNEIVQAKKNDNKIEKNEIILNYISKFAEINGYQINTKDLDSICTNKTME